MFSGSLTSIPGVILESLLHFMYKLHFILEQFLQSGIKGVLAIRLTVLGSHWAHPPALSETVLGELETKQTSH